MDQASGCWNEDLIANIFNQDEAESFENSSLSIQDPIFGCRNLLSPEKF